MKLADICEINPRAELLDDNTLVSFVAMPDVSEDGKINVDTHRTYGEVKKGFTNFKEGDVLFAKITPCMENGKGALATGLENGLGFGSTEFHVLRPNATIVLGQWLYYLTSWSAFRKDAEKHMTGSAGQKRVPKSFLEKYEVDLPTIDDQEYQVLQLNRIREIIDARRQQLSALDDLIKARFVEMFGDPVSNPKGWEKAALNNNATLLNGRAYKQEELLDTGKYPVLRVGNFFSNRGWYYSDLELEEDKYCDNGDLLYAWSASFGSQIWTGGRVIYHYHIWKVIVGDAYNKQFLCKLLDYATDSLMGDTHGIAMMHLTKSGMEQTEFIVPPLSLQEQFAAFVSQIDKSKSVIQKSLDETQLLFDSLMQKYFG